MGAGLFRQNRCKSSGVSRSSAPAAQGRVATFAGSAPSKRLAPSASGSRDKSSNFAREKQQGGPTVPAYSHAAIGFFDAYQADSKFRITSAFKFG